MNKSLTKALLHCLLDQAITKMLKNTTDYKNAVDFFFDDFLTASYQATMEEIHSAFFKALTNYVIYAFINLENNEQDLMLSAIKTITGLESESVYVQTKKIEDVFWGIEYFTPETVYDLINQAEAEGIEIDLAYEMFLYLGKQGKLAEMIY